MAEIGVWHKDENGNDVWQYGVYEITVRRFGDEKMPVPLSIMLYCGFESNSTFYWVPEHGSNFDIDGDWQPVPTCVVMEYCKTVERVRESLAILEGLTDA